MKIVSLVPSLTELLIDIGLTKELAGRTRFCVHPKEIIEQIPIIGGTKNPNIQKIKQIQPDFVVANKEENRKEDIEAIRGFSKVLVTDISSITDALLAINELGEKLGKRDTSHTLVNEIGMLLIETPKPDPLTTAYLIWKNPIMTVGYDTYIHDVMNHWALENVFGALKRYPEITIDDLKQKSPDVVLLSSEPYPFSDKHMDEFKKHLPNSRIILINGEWFSWYGSRMKPAFDALNTWRTSLNIK